MTDEQIIKKLEEACKMKLSNEQRDILTSGFNQPALVNACAGAGKTTMFMLSILFNAMKGINPENILGVTFSKDAQTDMEKKYQEYLEKIREVHVDTRKWGSPKFSTFHSLFWNLLKRLPRYRNANIIANGYKNYIPRFKLPNESQALTTAEQLEEIFNVRSMLINNLYSFNGIDMNIQNKEVQLVMQTTGDRSNALLISHLTNKTINSQWYQNYTYAVKRYEELKRGSQGIDFDDMQLLLLAETAGEDNLRAFKMQLEKYELVFLDEYQDINAIQWTLIKKVLSKKALSQLVAIGDDDQAIYSFRGSNPNFILEFPKKVKNAQVLNLSTNYRTSGAVLNIVKDAITNNKTRLDKSLQAFNSGGYAHFTEHILEDLSQNIDKYPDETHTVLVRYNRDKSIVIDYLANRDIFVNPKTKWTILQNDSFFNIYFNLMKAFYYDDFDLFAQYSQRIGFRSYKNHVNNIAKQYQPDKISEYLKLGHLTSFDYNVSETLRNIRQASSPDVIFDEIDILLTKYFEYTIDKVHLFSKVKYDVITDYMRKICSNYDDFELYEKKQVEIAEKLEATIKEKNGSENILVTTMHSSKGLEWENVYLYGLTNEDISTGKMMLNEIFPSTTTFNEFCNILSQDFYLTYIDYLFKANVPGLQPWLYALIGQRWHPEAIKFLGGIKSGSIDKLFAQDRMDLRSNIKMFNQKLHDGTNFKAATTLLYNGVVGNAKFIEDERRLLYVAITRAKKRLYIDRPVNPSPLLKELNLSEKPTEDVSEKFSLFE